MAVSLSAETKRRVAILFRSEEHAKVTKLLVDNCGSNLPFLERLNEKELERCRFAALKISRGDFRRLIEAVRLAKVDWRDLLAAAGFANDTTTHEKWLKPKRAQSRKRK